MTTPKKSYHWIQKRIESLDPYVDYEEIYRLSASYGGNDFVNSLIYALVFPNFVVTEHGARAVWREDGGKVFAAATARVEETATSNDTWWYYGPSDPRTQKSVEKINKRHEYWAKQYPGDFSHNEDYVYTLAFSAIFMHRLRLRLGLSGVSEKVKIASYIFMSEMAKLFYSEGRVPLTDWPPSWDGLIKYCEDFENSPRPSYEQGHLIASAIYEHFAFRWFPPSMRWLGRAIPTSLSLPTTLAAHRITPPNPVLKAIIVFALGCLLWVMETLGPDPQSAYLPELEQLPKEQKAERAREFQQLDHAFAPYFAARPENLSIGCPFRSNMKLQTSKIVDMD
ncbi:uncharacterized protein BDZ99DRAFT_469788 [Mytilinidion resinicola]|uniref:ER-bound oxygenase mpaB/mpaB'/Rubber oxygenase catalytic domain-containing protein n=1 Tax=Mytilinidion resinicola TaxID=574789 RepID=A0A6A6XYD3_9PEZI|nr:uncharacterized protein BDZ99DRAFT_469788 [Mytilinidion resinicola]KAF2801273.1 hypothetical protein BDZ99DRAFT_469788 [Mytilinidion resinicola]